MEKGTTASRTGSSIQGRKSKKCKKDEHISLSIGSLFKSCMRKGKPAGSQFSSSLEHGGEESNLSIKMG